MEYFLYSVLLFTVSRANMACANGIALLTAVFSSKVEDVCSLVRSAASALVLAGAGLGLLQWECGSDTEDNCYRGTFSRV